jgi:hypothetical protein
MCFIIKKGQTAGTLDFFTGEDPLPFPFTPVHFHIYINT